jgi:hypothetical protein
MFLIMDMQTLINFGAASVLTVIGWFARQLWEAVNRLKDDMKSLEISLPTNYVRKEDMECRFDRLEAMLGRVFEKLDNKADKS